MRQTDLLHSSVLIHTVLPSDIGDGHTLISVHRKYYTSAQEHVRKALGPMCNEAEQTEFLRSLQQAVFGSKGTLKPSPLLHTVCRSTHIILRSSSTRDNAHKILFLEKSAGTGTENKSGIFHHYWRVNNEKSIKYCEKLRDQLWEKISKKLAKGDSGYTYEHLTEDLKELEMEYRANAKGK